MSRVLRAASWHRQRTTGARRGHAFLVLALALGQAEPAAAEERRLDFSWSAPASCPDRQMVLHQLEAVLEANTVELDSAAVRGDIVRSGNEWVLSLDVQVGGARRVRRLAAESCDDLGKAAAVALGLLIRPLREDAESSPSVDAGTSAGSAGDAPIEPSATARHPGAGPSPPDAGLPDEGQRDEGQRDEAADAPEGNPAPLAWQLGVDAVADSSTLAGPSLGASIQSQLRVGAWGFGAYGLLLPARSRDVVGGSVEFEQWALGMRVCRALWPARPERDGEPPGAWRLDGCAGAELGRFLGSGSGLNRARNQVHDSWLAPSVGLHVGWHAFPHAGLVGRIEAVLPLQRENYVINVDEEVHETPTVTARASLGLAFDLL